MKKLFGIIAALLAIVTIAGSSVVIPCVGGVFVGVRTVNTCRPVNPNCDWVPFHWNEYDTQACAIWCCPRFPSSGWAYLMTDCTAIAKTGCCNDIGSEIVNPPSCPEPQNVNGGSGGG